MRFINGHYQNFEIKPINGLIPTLFEGASVIFAFAVTATSSVGQILSDPSALVSMHFYNVFQWIIYPESATLHVIIGAISGLVVVGAILKDEPELTRSVVQIIKKRLGKAD